MFNQQETYQQPTTLDQVANNMATMPIQGQNYGPEVPVSMGLDVTPPDRKVVMGQYLQNLGIQHQKMKQEQAGRAFLKGVHDIMSSNMTNEDRINNLINLKVQHGTDYGLGLDSIIKQVSEQSHQKEWRPTTMEEAIQFEKAKKTTNDNLSFGDMLPLQSSATKEEKASFLSQLPNDTQGLVKGLADYSLDLSKVSSIRGDQRQKLAGLVKMYDPTFDMNQYNARKNFINNLANGNLSKSIVSANTLIGHIDSLRKSFNELHNSNIPLINMGSNLAKTASGSGAPTAVKTNAIAVANELETLFRGTGGGSMQGIEDWKRQINNNMSPEQANAFISKAVELMGSRLQAIDSQYRNVMGKPREFSVLNGKSKKILSSMGMDPNQVEYTTEAQAIMQPQQEQQMQQAEPQINNGQKDFSSLWR